MVEAYLVFDIGTGNSRAGIVTEQGELIDFQSFENKYYRDFAYEDALYFIPSEMSDKILAGTRELLARQKEVKIKAVTATSARETIILIDEEGTPFYGLPNIDNRGTKWLKEIPDWDKVYVQTGRWVSNIFSAEKLIGLKKIHPDLYKRIAKITSLSEWIGYLFTGNLAMEHSQACETQLFDIERREWSKELCRTFDVDMRILPKLMVASDSLGKIKDSLCEKLGIPKEAVFIVGGADTQVAVKGVDLEEKEVAIVSGTTSPIVTIIPEKFYDKKQRCWVDCYIDGRSYQIETNAGVSGMNYQRLKHLFFEDVDYAVLDQEMKKKTRIMCVASLGTLVFSENKSLQNGGFYMPAPLDEEMDRYDFAYALVADIACGIAQQYGSLCSMIPHEKDYILGCGGGFQSEVLCQLIADLTHKELLIRSGYSQASLLGCVKICNRRLGIDNVVRPIDKRYSPADNPMINEYYKKWNAIRNLIN